MEHVSYIDVFAPYTSPISKIEIERAATLQTCVKYSDSSRALCLALSSKTAG
jgi:hypothetical protein